MQRHRHLDRRLLFLEQLETRRLCAISPQEQYFVYRINYARDNPVRYETERNLPVSLGYVTPTQPMAVVTSLFNSSEAKVNDMIAFNYFSHTSPSGLTANRQVRDHGYALPATLLVNGTNFVFPDSGNSIESLAAGYSTADAALDGLIVDAGTNPPGHRNHLLSITEPATVYNEVGLGYAFNASTTYDYYWAIHSATRDASVRYVTGVVYNDGDNDSRYDQGEGLSGVTVDIPAMSLSTTTNAAGGWAIAVPDGEYEVRAQGGSFSGVSTTPVRISGRSEEVDFRSGRPFGQFSFDDWVNTAPVLNTAGNPTLNPVFVTPGPTPQGTPIASLIAGALSDVDPVPRRGIAVTGVTSNAGGTWQYFTGGSWTNLPVVSLSAAFLLRETDQLRYINPSGVGTATISYRGWDQTTGNAGGTSNLNLGTGGTTAFSTAEETATINVLSSNRSPVLTPTGNRTLPNVTEDATNPSGATVASILGTTATDADTGTRVGLGVSAVGSNGTWQYSLDSGGTWLAVPALAVGDVLPLRDADWLRFVPAANFAGTSTIDYYAWDQFLGLPGVATSRTASPPAGHQGSFSTASDQARVTVTPVNDAPVLAGGQQAWLNPIPINTAFSGSGGTLVSEILGQIDSDADAGALRGIAIISRAGNGNWWFQNNGSWSSGTTTDANAWLLKSTDRVQFVPNSGFTGTSTITFRAWDQTTGPEISGIWANLSTPDKYGGTRAYSAQTQIGTIFVGAAGTSPSVSSITRADPNPVSGDTARFNVSFSESVNNVTPADFALQRFGSANGVIASITGSGSSYVVTVNQITGSGRLGLALDVNRDIRDSVGNRATMAAPGTSEQYDITAASLTVSLNIGSIAENAGAGAATGTVTLESTSPSPVTVTLTSSDPSEATVPATVTILANQLSANFAIGAVDDTLLDGTQTASISAVATGYNSGSVNVNVTDFETLTITITPGNISENGGTATGTVTRSNTDNGQPLVVTLVSNDLTEATVPSTVTILANQAAVSFQVTAIDDALIDGTQVVTITGSATGYVNGSRTLDISDDDLFRVTQSAATATGMVLNFNRDLNVSTLNVYDLQGALFGAADVTLVGATMGAVRGSVVIDPGLRRLTFIATAGTLPADTYTLTLRSAANGFVDTTVGLLDGDANGTAGGNYVQTFSVTAPPVNAVTLSVANFARGPQQAVNVPATVSSGLPVSFSNGGGITVANFEVRYNPALLTITGATVAPGLPVGAAVNINTSTPGLAVIQFSSPTPLVAGTTRFIDLQATVPTTATYRSKHVLDIGNIVLNPGPTPIPSVDDDALHIAAYFGDTTGNGLYSSTDASRISRVAVAFDTGFELYKLLDPVIIGDITGNGLISSSDTSRMLQLAVAFPVTEVPALPLPAVSLTQGGPDPKLSIPTNLVATQGNELIVPVHIDSIVDLTGTGFGSADLVIFYDPLVLDVTSVSLGSLITNRGNWLIASRIDALAGRIFVSVAGNVPLEGFFQGELVKLHAAVKANAPLGSTSINLAASAHNTAQYTQLNEGYLTLIPSPTNAASDPVDGLLTITAAVKSVPTNEPSVRIVNDQLLIVGTSNDDRIIVAALPNDQVRVRVGNHWLGDFPRPSGLAIDGLTGHDIIYVDPALPATVVAADEVANVLVEDVIFAATNSLLVETMLPAVASGVAVPPLNSDPRAARDLALLQMLADWSREVPDHDGASSARINRARRR